MRVLSADAPRPVSAVASVPINFVYNTVGSTNSNNGTPNLYQSQLPAIQGLCRTAKAAMG
jgi:hypothetical protein